MWFQRAVQTARAPATALVVALLEATVGVGVGEPDRQAALRATAGDAFAELHLERRTGLPLGTVSAAVSKYAGITRYVPVYLLAYLPRAARKVTSCRPPTEGRPGGPRR